MPGNPWEEGDAAATGEKEGWLGRSMVDNGPDSSQACNDEC
jgi:hypothetical protein